MKPYDGEQKANKHFSFSASEDFRECSWRSATLVAADLSRQVGSGLTTLSTSGMFRRAGTPKATSGT